MIEQKFSNSNSNSTFDKASLFKKVRNFYDKFTPAQKAIAEFIIHNPESLLFMSISSLSKEIKVSMATIVRFCKVLGFNGYYQMIKEAQHELQTQLNILDRYHIAKTRRTKKIDQKNKKWEDSAFTRILNHEIENLNHMANSISIKQFQSAVNLINNSDRILIIGCMASASLSNHMGNMLCKIISDVDVVDSEGVFNIGKINRLTDQSLIIVIAFPRYPSATFRMTNTAIESGVQSIIITDSHLSPISGLGKITFHIPVGVPSFVDAYAAPLTFISALCTEVSETKPSRTEFSLRKYDDFVLKNKIFVRNSWNRKIHLDRKS